MYAILYKLYTISIKYWDDLQFFKAVLSERHRKENIFNRKT